MGRKPDSYDGGASSSSHRYSFFLFFNKSSPQLKQKLERAILGIPLTDDDLAFSNFDGKPLSPDNVTHAWIKLVRRVGVKPIRLHDARHTHASLMLKEQGSL